MDYNRDDLLSMMYQEEEPETKKQPEAQIEPSGFNRTRKVRVGVVEYELPTVEYVQRLEQMVSKQAHTIEQQKRAIERLQGFMLSTRNFIRRQTGRLQDIQEDLDHKIDLRESL